MSTVFFTADHHFGHRAVLNFSPARNHYADVTEHDADLVSRWNRYVGPRDVVWHLGDLAWTQYALFEWVPQLAGRIQLVMGNHDTFDANLYLALGIESLHGCVSWKRGLLLSHMPCVPSPKRYNYNIHGHTHEVSMGTLYHICVSVEQWGLRPVSLDEVQDLIKQRSESME